MTERKPANETWESFAERKIRQAQSEGAFDALPGLGKSIPNWDGFDDPNGWVRDKLRRENLNVLPPVLEARLDIEKTLAAVRSMRSERQIRQALGSLNQRIREAQFSIVAGPACGVALIDVEATVREILASVRIDAPQRPPK